MNTRRFLLTGAFSTLLLFSACKKDDANPTTDPDGKITFKIDGVNWQSESIVRAEVRHLDLGENVFSKSLLLSAKGEDGSSLSLTISDVYTTEDGGHCLNDISYYSVDDPNFDENFMVTTDQGVTFSSGVSLSITKADGNYLLDETGSATVSGCEGETINGSFEFESNDLLSEDGETVSISSGKFTDIKFEFL